LKLTRKSVAVLMFACVAACGAENKEEASAEAAQPGAAATEAVAVPDGGSDAAGIPVPETVEIDGVGTVRRVGDDLLFAGQPSPEALRTLAAQGIRTVLNTRGEGELDWDERALAEELGMTYAEIPMAYPIESISDDWVERFDKVMAGADRPILMHCSSGNRVAGLWAVWLAERQGVPAAAALEVGTRAGMTRIRAVVEQRLAPSPPE